MKRERVLLRMTSATTPAGRPRPWSREPTTGNDSKRRKRERESFKRRNAKQELFSLQRGGVREEEVVVEGATDKFFVSSLYFHSPLFSLHSLSLRSITC